MIKQIFILMLFAMLVTSYNVFAGDIDNSVILERIDSLSKRMDDKFDAVNKRIDDMRDSVNRRIDDVNKRIDDSRAYDIAIIIAIISLVVIIIWDRRTALKPVYDKMKEFKEQLESCRDDRKEKLQKFKPVT